MGFVSGQVPGCHWQCLSGHDEHTWGALVDNLIRIAPAIQQGDVIVDIWHDAGLPTAVQRRRFAELFEQTPAIRRVGAHVVVTNSTLTRGALSAVNWVIKRPFDERIFPKPTAAFAWMRANHERADTNALTAALTAAVPGWSTLPW